MQKALHVRTKVLPGGKIEILDEGLPVGESVDVVVSQSTSSERRSTILYSNSFREDPTQVHPFSCFLTNLW